MGIFTKKTKKRIKDRLIDRDSVVRPSKFTSDDLRNCAEGYKETVAALVKEIEEFGADKSAKEIHAPSTAFTGYRIASYNGDRMGKVLIRDGGIYRGVYAEKCEDFRELWETGLLQVLGRHGFIPETEVTDYYTGEYGLILHHKTVEMSASLSWTFSMIRDASVHAILLNEVLQHFGFKLHDGHLNNLTFHQGKPVFTDIGSIVKDRGQNTSFFKELVFSGCYRLACMQLGNSVIARTQVFDENNNSIWIYPKVYNDSMREYRLILRQYKRRFGLFSLQRRVAGRVFDGYEVRPEYLDCLFGTPNFKKVLGELTELDRDTDRICSELRELKPASLLLLGGTGGAQLKSFSEMPFIERLCCTEIDFASGETAYELVKKHGIKANVFLYHHLYASDTDTKDMLLSDAVVVNDITNQVVTTQFYRADSLCNAVAKLTRKYALVTVYPGKDENEHFEHDSSSIRAAMEEAFGQFFNILNVIELGNTEEKEKYAVLFVGEKK